MSLTRKRASAVRGKRAGRWNGPEYLWTGFSHLVSFLYSFSTDTHLALPLPNLLVS